VDQGPNGRGLRPVEPWTKAWKVENWGMKGRRPRPKGPRIEAHRAQLAARLLGEGSQPPHHELKSGEWCKLRIGVRGRAPAAKLFSRSKGNMNCWKKCHHIWNRPSSHLGMIYCYSTVPLALSYGRNNQQIILTSDDSANTYISHWTVPHLHRNEMYSQTSSQRNDLRSKYYT